MLIILGTKTESRIDNSSKYISSNEGRAAAKEIGAAEFLECSAARFEGVNYMVEVAVKLVSSRFREKPKSFMEMVSGFTSKVPSMQYRDTSWLST